jgi:betaine-aldehyde dehydrogenase
MAIAAGNTLVLKAAEDAPLGLLRVAEICNDHLPPGVLNLITGYGEEAGAALARHPLVRKLSFTGSTEVGKLIMHAAADRIVPVSLELGGKSPAIVFPDADEQRTVDGVITGMRVTRQGQSCTAGSRLFLHRSIFDSFVSKLTATLQKFKIGDPTDEAIDMGAIINRKQFDRVCGYIADGIQQKGARLALGGLPPKDGPLASGYFVQPTVFSDVSNDWRIAREEIFGPVACVVRAKNYDEALALANDTEFGLSSGIVTTSLKHASHFKRHAQVGMVMVNVPTAGVDYHVPFGGRKGSSYGSREQGRYAAEFFTTVKTAYTAP